MSRPNVARYGLLAASLMAITLGCNKSDESAPPPAVVPPGPGVAKLDETGPHAAGKKVFNTHGCANCHGMGGSPAKGKGKGPDLSKVGADPEHSEEWLAEFIRDPKSKKPTSRMPAFQGKINDDEFKALVGFLASLK